MKKTFQILGIFLIVVALGVIIYFFFFMKQSTVIDRDIPFSSSGVIVSEMPIDQQKSGDVSTEKVSFEESFYNDMSDFFDSSTNYYEYVGGDYGFVQ